MPAPRPKTRYAYLLELRNRHFLLLDTLWLLITPWLALILRVGITPAIWERYGFPLFVYMFATMLLRLAIFYFFGLYRRYWRYASVGELNQISIAIFITTGIIFAITFPVSVFLSPNNYFLPRSLPLIDGLLVLLLVGGARFSVRLAYSLNRTRPGQDSRRVLVVGAGDAGTMIVREMQNNPQLGLEVVGFIDDDHKKHNVAIYGVSVLGGRDDIGKLVKSYGIDQVIIAMPTAPGKVIREIRQLCEQAQVETRTMPGMYELLDGRVHVNQLRHVEIEDLLRREPVQTDIAAIQQLLHGKRVLVTGGGGSIGSELCRQIMRCGPAGLLLIGHGENSIFDIQNELNQTFRGTHAIIQSAIADVRFPERIMAIFEAYRPEIVFHAAAHKHVPLMELNPAEAITNNVEGTRNVLRAAQAVGVERFVMISTDKAVNPTSIMGATKRVAELLVHQAGRNTGRAYVAVRFGNVLGSRGSVVLTFKKQIAAGGPVTITHPEMTRFFMTIPEAVQLVLQAAVLGNGGEVFVLDMGKPVKILDLARDLIELSGLVVGQDVEIVITGPRPGEKLYEELFILGEGYVGTRHEKIFVAENASNLVPANLDCDLAALLAAAQTNNPQAIRQCLKQLVPEYTQQYYHS